MCARLEREREGGKGLEIFIERGVEGPCVIVVLCVCVGVVCIVVFL